MVSFEEKVLITIQTGREETSSGISAPKIAGVGGPDRTASKDRATQLLSTIPNRFARAVSVSDGALTTLAPTPIGFECTGFGIHWAGSPPARRLSIIVDSSEGFVEWAWGVFGARTGARVDALEFTDTCLEGLILDMVYQSRWIVD